MSGKGGRKRSLCASECKKLQKIAERYPFATLNETRKEFLNKCSKNLSISTIYRELHIRAGNPFVMKVPNTSTTDKNLERIYDMQFGFKGRTLFAFANSKQSLLLNYHL